jgi:leucyl-tRNA synthetase
MGGFPGSIGAARAFAFTLGTSEYVSFVDDDDEIDEKAFYKCLKTIDRHKTIVGVYTDTRHVHPNGRADIEYKGRPWSAKKQLKRISEITHLKIMRRCHVEPYLDELAKWPTYEEYVLCGLMAERGPWHHIPIVGADKRYKPASESSMRLATRELWNKAISKVSTTLNDTNRLS